MDIKFTILRKCLLNRLAAGVAITLLFASGVNPASFPVQFTESTVCISADANSSARIQYSKGEIEYVSVNREKLLRGARELIDGDRIYTGADGFVSIIFASGRYLNIQPVSRVQVIYSHTCSEGLTSSDSSGVTLESAYLTAAIRG